VFSHIVFFVWNTLVDIYNNTKNLVFTKNYQKQGIVKYGPYGSSSPQNFDWQLLHAERFTRVTIRHGWIVDAIQFNVRRPDGSTKLVKFGGNGGSQSHVNTP
jgi:jacalin-like lectin domain-containing protein